MNKLEFHGKSLVYSSSYNYYIDLLFMDVYKKRGLPWQAGHPSTHTVSLFFLSCVCKAARVTQVGRYSFLEVKLRQSLKKNWLKINMIFVQHTVLANSSNQDK